MGSELLLCGATGALGGEIARHLAAHGVPFRALVRPASSTVALDAIGAEIVRGDLRDRASLDVAVAGMKTVVSTANAIGRMLGGQRDVTIAEVDDRGYAELIAAADAAGVERFVYVSTLEDQTDAHTPFTDAKAATERRLREARVREVIVRADMFQEIWLGPAGGFDVDHAKVTIYGRGTARHRMVATEDVAEAVVRVALAADPPREVLLAGPEALSVEEAVAAFEQRLGTRMHVRHVPRVAMRVGRTLLKPVRPELASVMGMALAGDLSDTAVDATGFRELGIEPRRASTYIEAVASR
jgi:uncharacterized protein YbjT (DUF2867 family)